MFEPAYMKDDTINKQRKHHKGTKGDKFQFYDKNQLIVQLNKQENLLGGDAKEKGERTLLLL
jgi:hypothetical protein